MVSFYFSESLNFTVVGISASLAVTGILSLTFRSFLGLVKEDFYSVGPFLAGNCCVGLILLCLILPLYLILVTQNITMDMVYNIVKIVGTGVGMLLIGPWVYYHFRYFHSAKSYFSFVFNRVPTSENRKNKIEAIFKWGTSGTIFVVTAACIATCVFGVYNSLKVGKTNDLIIYSVLLIAVPLFLYCGVNITKAKIDTENKFFVFTLLCGILPLGATLPAYVFITDYQYVTKYFVVLPPFSMVILAFLSMFSKPEARYNTCLALICLTIMFPLGFLYPLLDSSLVPFIPVLFIICILVSVPIILLIYLVFNIFQDFWRLSRPEKLKKLKSANYYYPVIYTIMLIFTFAEATLIYVFCNDLAEDPGHGSIIGMIAFLPFVYTSSSLTMQLKLNSEQELTNYSQKQKYQFISFIVCIVIAPVAIIFVFTLDFIGIFFVSVMKSLSIGVPLLSLITIVLLQIKYKLAQEYSSISMLSANLILWVFFVVPVCVIFPLSLAGSSSAKKTNKYIGVLIVYLGLLFMVFISGSSMVYNAYKNKMSREMLARKCVFIVQGQLDRLKIKSTQKVIREMFEEFAFQKYKDDFRHTLMGKTRFTMEDPLPEDFLYSKEIFTADDYLEKSKEKDKKEKQMDYNKQEELRKKKEELERKKNENKKFSFWLLLRCFDEFPEELKEKVEPVHRPKMRLEDFDIEKAQDPISISEFGNIIPAEYDMLREPYPVNNIGNDLNFLQFSSSSTLENLKIYRTERQDWLRSVFRFIANEPNEISVDPWISETIIFHICRKGGITSELIPDKDLRYIYIRSVTDNEYQIMDEDFFIENFIPLIASYLFKEFDPISQEKKLIIDILFPNINKNINSILQDPDYLASKEVPDKLQETIKRRLTLQAARRRSGTIIKKSRTLQLIALQQLNDSNPQSNYIGKTNFYKPTPKSNSCFMSCFNSIGNFYLSTGLTLSDKLESYLKQYYSPPKKDSELELELPKIEEKNDKLDPEILTPVQEWEYVCGMFVKIVKDIVDDDEKQNKITAPNQILWNPSNILAIVFKIVEIMQLSSLGFKKEINWEVIAMPLSVNEVANAANSDPDKNTIIIFWCIFAVAGIYGFIGYRSFDEIKKAKLARTEDGHKVGIREAGFWKKKFLNIFGGGLYIFIIKYIMNIFACEYNSDPPVIPKASIECYTPLHIGLMVSALFSLLIYYPIATFLFPLLQFNDTDLNFKHNQTFLIILSQAKLFISGVKVFLPYSLYYEWQLLISSMVLCFLFLYTFIRKPCVEWRFNLWSSFGYFFSCFTNFFAYINVLVGGSVVVSFCYFAVIATGLFSSLIAHLMLSLRNRVKVVDGEQSSTSKVALKDVDSRGETFIMRDSSMVQLVE